VLYSSSGGRNICLIVPCASLERFYNSRALSGIVQDGIYFHPSDEDLLLGPQLRKMPFEDSGFGVQQL
jgi:hypothetical protein